MSQTPAEIPARERTPVPNPEDPTIGKLVVDVSNNVSTLVRKEIELAKAELSFSAKVGVIGVVFFAVAAFVGVLAIIMLSVAFAYLIHFTGLDLAWCFLIVFGAYLLLAGLFALLGLRSVKKVRGPERSVAELKKTQAALKNRKAKG